MQTTLLTNSEYNLLYNKGGDCLVSFFATLRANKIDTVFKKVGKKGTHSTLRHYTNLSVNSIRKYLPMLIELNICEVHNNGNIALHSRNYNRKNIKGMINYKLIPIRVYDKFSLTKTSSYFVRIHSNLELQQKGITKHSEQIQRYSRYKNGSISSKELKSLQRLQRKGINEISLKSSYRSTTTICNESFSKFKGNHLNKKSSGNYHKSKLIKMGIISQKRDYKVFLKGTFTRADLLYLRHKENIKGLFLNANSILKEISPIISICYKVGTSKS